MMVTDLALFGSTLLFSLSILYSVYIWSNTMRAIATCKYVGEIAREALGLFEIELLRPYMPREDFVREFRSSPSGRRAPE